MVIIARCLYRCQAKGKERKISVTVDTARTIQYNIEKQVTEGMIG